MKQLPRKAIPLYGAIITDWGGKAPFGITFYEVILWQKITNDFKGTFADFTIRLQPHTRNMYMTRTGGSIK